MITKEEIIELQGSRTNREFAAMIGVGEVHLSRLRHGKRHTGKKLEERIRVLFGKPMSRKHTVVTAFKEAVDGLMGWIESLEE